MAWASTPPSGPAIPLTHPRHDVGPPSGKEVPRTAGREHRLFVLVVIQGEVVALPLLAIHHHEDGIARVGCSLAANPHAVPTGGSALERHVALIVALEWLTYLWGRIGAPNIDTFHAGFDTERLVAASMKTIRQSRVRAD